MNALTTNSIERIDGSQTNIISSSLFFFRDVNVFIRSSNIWLSYIHNMISRAIWCEWARVQFVVFENLTRACLHCIAREIMLLLADNLHEKRITKSQDGRNISKAHA